MKNFFILFLFFFIKFAAFSQNKTWTCINEKGEKVFSFQAKFTYEYNNEMARIEQQNLINNQWVRGYGYMDVNGKIIIPCEYEKAADFVDDRAWVLKKGEKKYTLINRKGEVIPTKGYEKVGYIMEGFSDRIAVYENGAMGWINRDGEEVIPCKFLGSSTFDPEFGLSCVMPFDAETEKYGFINKAGEVVIPYQFKQAGTSAFNNGLCRAAVNGKTVMINEKGEVVFSSKYGSLQRLNQGLMAVPTKPNRTGWGFVNLQDEMVVPAIYDYVSEFNEDGYAVVEKNKLSGIINTKGEIIIDLKYETIYCDVTKDGYICCVLPSAEPTSLLKANKDYFNKALEPIDLNGNTLLPANYGNLIPFMASDTKRGFMNRDYEIVIPAIYSKSTGFNSGLAIVLE